MLSFIHVTGICKYQKSCRFVPTLVMKALKGKGKSRLISLLLIFLSSSIVLNAVFGQPFVLRHIHAHYAEGIHYLDNDCDKVSLASSPLEKTEDKQEIEDSDDTNLNHFFNAYYKQFILSIPAFRFINWGTCTSPQVTSDPLPLYILLHYWKGYLS
jgi:hypothetical protein